MPDGQWYCHLFAPEQPDLNWDNREVRDDFLHTLRFWADRGVDGYRVDVAHALAKDLSEPLRSKPTLEDEGLPLDGTDPLYDRDEVHEIYAEWRQVFNDYDPPRTAVAEAFAPRRSAAPSTPARPGSVRRSTSTCSRPTTRRPTFRDVITFCLNEAAKTGSSSTWVLSNHDVVRHASRYGLPAGADYDAWLMTDGTSPGRRTLAAGLRRARAATLLMLALPGSAYLYQGEELGLHEVADLPADALQDPIWLRTGNTKKGRDGCRVPLPWTHRRALVRLRRRRRAGCRSRPASPGQSVAGQERSRRLDAGALPRRRCGCGASCRPPRSWSGSRPRTPRCCTSSAPAAGTA